MTLTENDAAKLVGSVLDSIQAIGGHEILDGIEESRRLGIEEALPEQKGSELKQVARTRRRPPTNVEMLHIVLKTLYQRLIVLPNIAVTTRKRLGADDVLWHVDTEFVSIDRFPRSRLSDLSPGGVDDVATAFNEVIKLIPAHIVEPET